MKILIDRSTIKRNPNAGNTVHYMYGKQFYYRETVTHTVDEQQLPVWVKKKYIINGNSDAFKIAEQKYYQVENPFNWTLREWMEQPTEEIHSLTPESDYLYDYLPTLVQCNCCGIMIEYKDLESNSMHSEGDEIYSDKVCPHCGAFECCEIEFEKFTKDMIRQIP